MLLHFRDILVLVLQIALGVITASLIADANATGTLAAWLFAAFIVLMGTLVITAIFMIGRPRPPRQRTP